MTGEGYGRMGGTLLGPTTCVFAPGSVNGSQPDTTREEGSLGRVVEVR